MLRSAVCPPIWTFFYSIYGGGPVIARGVFIVFFALESAYHAKQCRSSAVQHCRSSVLFATLKVEFCP
jgi:hypothetical protein